MYWKWCSVMFPYGLYRGWNCEENHITRLKAQRVFWSVLNGVTYTTPLGIYHLFMQVNRFDIEYHQLDKNQYSYCYQESFGINYNTV
jgi:hypothetical protein